MTYHLLKAGITELVFSDFFSEAHSSTKGRPVANDQSIVFQNLCSHIDSSDEYQYSLSELEAKLHEYSGGGEVYSTKHLKRKSEEHYGETLTITYIPGKPSIFTFHEYSHKVLHDKWYSERCDNEADERKRIVETAASIIRQDIRAMVYDSSVYPDPKDITCAAPESLKSFVQNVIDYKHTNKNQVKVEAIIQSIIAATRPRSFVPPLLLAIAVYIHRKYGSKELIELLNKLCFSESYLEVKRYMNIH